MPTYQMHGASGVCFADFLLEDLGAVDWAARRGHTRDENLSPVRLEHVLNPAPVRNLQGGNGQAERDGVEAEQPMTEYDGVLRACVCVQRRGVSVKHKTGRGTRQWGSAVHVQCSRMLFCDAAVDAPSPSLKNGWIRSPRAASSSWPNQLRGLASVGNVSLPLGGVVVVVCKLRS